MRTTGLAMGLAGALASACATSGGETLQPLGADLAASARVDEVVLVGGPEGGVSEGFGAAFQARVKEKLAGCATGTTPLRAEVTLSEFKRANLALAYVADASRIVGQVKLVNPADGAVVGDYAISREFRAPGVVGVAMTLGAEQQMSDAFVDELCKRAFGAAEDEPAR